MARKDITARFLEKVDKSTGCWLWTSAVGSRGYGIFWVGGEKRNMFAHRFSYELHKGPIPSGLVIMHSCDTPLCVNPDHLAPGSIRDNALDAKAKGRLAMGSKNGGGRKLDEDQVRQIWQTRNVLGCHRSAAKFGVSSQTIKAIRRGRIWNSITGAPDDHRQAGRH